MRVKNPANIFRGVFFASRIDSGTTTKGRKSTVAKNRKIEPTVVAYWGLLRATMAAMKSLTFLFRDLKLPYHWLKAVLASVVYGFPSRSITIIGITGTDGKTTTSTMMYQILKASGKKVALITTVSAVVGDEEIDTGFHVTSPSPFALQSLLKKLVQQGYTHLVLEVTSHGIHQYRVWGIEPEVTVLTNITPEHLDYHGTFEAYLQVKASFIARAKKMAFINSTDRSYLPVRAILEKKNTPFTTYTLSSPPAGVQRVIAEKFVESYNQFNATAAVLACKDLGVTDAQCKEGLLSFSGVPGRMEFIEEFDGVLGYVDFAHTPNSLEEALRALRMKVKKGRQLIAVFGAAGKRDSSKRPAMGKVASECADQVVLTSEDTRGEDPETIIRQLKEGVTRKWGHVFGIADRREAIRFATVQLAKPGDVVAVFGKGHEKSMNMDGRHEIPWSDQDELRHALHLRMIPKKTPSSLSGKNA